MDAMVPARVPVEVRDRANAIMKRIGITPTQLINNAYENLLATGELLHGSEPEPAADCSRTLTKEQRGLLEKRFVSRSHRSSATSSFGHRRSRSPTSSAS